MYRGVMSSALASHWRREVLRTSLWVVPAIEVVAAVVLFAVTLVLDRAAYRGAFTVPPWVISGTSDAARQILTAIAAAVITVVGVVFSIILVTLTLASTQFGPRMLRNFIRDRGTQLTLGTFVATFVYAVLVLVSIGPGSHGDFVPHIGVTVTLGLMVADLGILIYFIHHTAISIQLPQVIASIARDLAARSRNRAATPDPAASRPDRGPSPAELLSSDGDRRRGSPRAGQRLPAVHQAPDPGAVRRESRRRDQPRAPAGPLHRPGTAVCPGMAARGGAAGERGARAGPLTGPYRTLSQDLSFGVDQLVEIAIRALSAAVNDTFTALTCIDWLGDNLCKIASRWHPARVHRDDQGFVRVVAAQPGYERLVQRAFEKIRQSSQGMPAVMIRQLEALAKIMAETSGAGQRRVLIDQAMMIERASERSVPEEADRADVRRRFEAVLAIEAGLADRERTGSAS